MKSVVYDAGVLIAADRSKRSVWAEHRVRLEAGWVPLVPAPVVAQVSRSPKQAQMRRLLRGCEVIAFDDGSSVGSGRAVWTDSRGDRVFSALRGDAIQTGRRITATITGGTGRYAGATGEYALTWQYVVTAEDGIQGRTADLTGRLRVERQP